MSACPTAAEVAGRLGLPRSRRGYRGRCPVCGNDALEVRSVEGHLRAVCFYGCAPDELRRAVGGEHLAAAVAHAARPGPSDAERTAAALVVWNGAVAAHPALTAYCAARSLPGLERSPALRWRPDVRHPEERGLHPAVVGLVVDVLGRPLGVHRTYTRRDGSGKADLRPPKASKGPTEGGAIRLDPAGPELLIGEGIESSAAAGRLLGLPAWAGINAGNIERSLALPPEVRRVVVAADPDPAGLRGADGAARRWAAEWRTVRIIVPDLPGQDFADLHAAQSAEAV